MRAEIVSYREEYYPKSDRFIILNVYTPLNYSKIIDLPNLIELISDGCFHSFGENKDSSLLKSFRIDFFDYIDCGSLLGYLNNKKSDYRLTRLSDGIIIRASHGDLKRITRELVDFSDAEPYTVGFEIPNDSNENRPRKKLYRYGRLNRK